MKNLRNLIVGMKDRCTTHTAKGTILSLLLTTCAALTACTDKSEELEQTDETTQIPGACITGPCRKLQENNPNFTIRKASLNSGAYLSLWYKYSNIYD